MYNWCVCVYVCMCTFICVIKYTAASMDETLFISIRSHKGLKQTFRHLEEVSSRGVKHVKQYFVCVCDVNNNIHGVVVLYVYTKRVC